MGFEMTPRERLLAASRKQRADRLPFFHTWRHMQTGQAERECRNRGMGITWARPSCIMKMHGVTQVEEMDRSDPFTVRRTYSTPVGSISVVEKRAPGTGQWHALRGWKDRSPWLVERALKTPEDYKVFKYMVENTEYVPDYFPIEQAKEWLGDDGIVVDTLFGILWDFLPHSPMQALMVDWIGTEGGRCYIHQAKYRDLVDDVYQAFSKSYEAMYEIAGKSPADVVWYGDNIDGVLVSPPLFEKYFMPEYEKFARILHAQGKLLAVHMDGRVGVLKDLIARTPIDIVEALHPPTMGDLPIGEALSLWKDKVIWMTFPVTVYGLGSQAVMELAVNLLKEVIPGERLAISMSSEDLVSNENLLKLTSVLEKVALPLTKEKIAQIEKSFS